MTRFLFFLDYPLEQARDKEGHRFNFSTKDTFKYESSDNEGEGDENITDVPESEVKSNWNDSLFFNIDDIRFEGRCFGEAMKCWDTLELCNYFLVI